ncbi:MAG: hypothetical protein HKO57_02180 [Akkermansiaceae bacterium]|nr:hypothetical protein [Akkermansiaceae bacterium]
MIVLFVRNRITGEEAPQVNQAELDERRREQAEKAEVNDYLRRQIPECRDVLDRFFRAGDAAERAQSVYDPVRVTPYMAAYYRHNPPRRPSGVLKPLLTNLYVDDDQRAIETVWADPGGDEMEMVFIRDQGQWKIDWEAFVRYSTAEWLLFITGSPREGEFRVYMRRIELSQQAGREPMFGLKFYPASYDSRIRSRGESDTVLVPRDGEVGQRLQQLFTVSGQSPDVGDSKLAERDPEDLYRVRVRLAWKDGRDGNPYLSLQNLVAANWYAEGFEDIGLEDRRPPEETRAENTLEQPGDEDGSEEIPGPAEPAAPELPEN